MIPLPEAFICELRAQLGNEAGLLFEALDGPYAAALRLNPLREGALDAAAAFLDGTVPWCPDGRYIRSGTRPGLSPVQAAGGFYIQEASAMAPAMLLNVQPGELVLDLCAAPGGKSGQLAAALANTGALVANEPDPSRAKILASTLERLGAGNTLVTNAYPAELAKVFPETFDAILCDAPCSGEGMFRREPDSRLEWKAGSPEGCAARQAEILDQAALMLKPGGRLVYSTCTFNRHENADNIAAFLKRHPDFAPAAFDLPGVGASENGCVQLWPQRVRGDGQFAALLTKAGNPADAPKQNRAGTKSKNGNRASRPDAAERETRDALDALRGIAPGWDARLDRPRIERRGEFLFALPACLPDAPGIKTLRAGLRLCRIGRGYIEPDHTLAMFLKPGEAANTIELDEDAAVRALSGEVLRGEGKGWTLLTHRGMPLGWGKVSGGEIKNHIPKGLRIQK